MNHSLIGKALLKIAHNRNIVVFIAKLPGGVNGIHFKNEDVQVIGLSSELTEQEYDFVLAHELGHATLHSNFNFALYHQYESYHDKIEQQADKFAEKLIGYLKGANG